MFNFTSTVIVTINKELSNTCVL